MKAIVSLITILACLTLVSCKKDKTEKPYGCQDYTTQWEGAYEIKGVRSWYNPLDSGVDSITVTYTFHTHCFDTTETMLFLERNVHVPVNDTGYYAGYVNSSGSYTYLTVHFYTLDSIYFKSVDAYSPGSGATFTGYGKLL